MAMQELFLHILKTLKVACDSPCRHALIAKCRLKYLK